MTSDACALFTPEDFNVAADLAQFFANFAKYGDPNASAGNQTKVVLEKVHFLKLCKKMIFLIEASALGSSHSGILRIP